MVENHPSKMLLEIKKIENTEWGKKKKIKWK